MFNLTEYVCFVYVPYFDFYLLQNVENWKILFFEPDNRCTDIVAYPSYLRSWGKATLILNLTTIGKQTRKQHYLYMGSWILGYEQITIKIVQVYIQFRKYQFSLVHDKQ